MDAWAASYGSAVAFICVSCAGPQLASQFGNELRLKHCHNTWVDEDEMPAWGQLGCNGLIVIDGSDTVVCKASPAYLEVKDAAFRHVETLLEALLASQPAPQLLPGRVDGSVGGRCAEVRFGSDGEEAEVIVSGLKSRPELNGKRARVLSERANGRVEVQVEGEAAPLSIKRQNLALARDETEAKGGADAGSPAGAVGKVPSVKVAVLDEQHARCEAALAKLGERRDAEALRELLATYEEHFAHEEALLDEHLYAGVEHTDGFSADKGARTSHFGDHELMLSSIRTLLSRGSVTAAEVEHLAVDFERHATAYDGSYADRLSAAMAQAKPVAVA